MKKLYSIMLIIIIIILLNTNTIAKTNDDNEKIIIRTQTQENKRNTDILVGVTIVFAGYAYFLRRHYYKKFLNRGIIYF